MQQSLSGITVETGLLFGADYNPEQWPEESWPEDIELMQRARVNLVAVGVFSWAKLEPSEGEYDFGWMDRLLDLLHAGGIRVALATPTASPPPWLGHKYPQTLPQTREGTVLWYGSRNQFAPCSLKYQQAALAITEQLANRYAKHPAVAMWHVGNELGQVSYDDQTAEQFRSWLRQRYGTLEELNRAWGTAFWSQQYSDWDEIIPPLTAPYLLNPSQVLDFNRFTSHSLLELYKGEREMIRRYADQPITTNLMGFFRGADYHRFAPELDFISNNWYVDPAQPSSIALGSLTHALLSGMSQGKPWLLMESATSAVNWRQHNAAKEPGAARIDAFSALARGADGVCFFQFRQSAIGAERFHSAMVPLAGSDTRIFSEVCDLGRQLQRLRPLAGTQSSAEVAMLFDWESWWAVESPDGPTDRLDVLEQLQAYCRPLLRRGVNLQVVHPSAELSGYKVVLCPSLFLLREEHAVKLAQFVADGGRLVVGPFCDVADEEARLHTGRFPRGLREVMGTSGEEWRPLSAPVQLLQHTTQDAGTYGTASIWSEALRLEGDQATALATFAEGALAGKPAVVANEYGEGRTWYIGTDLSEEALDRLIANALESAAVHALAAGQLPEGIEVIQRGRFVFVLNHTNQSHEIQLRCGGTDLLTGQRHEASFQLEAYGARVLETAPARQGMKTTSRN